MEYGLHVDYYATLKCRRKMEGSMSDHTDKLLAGYTGKLADYTRWLMFASVLSFACTLWIAWSTKQLRDFAEEQAEDMKAQIRITHDAIDAANRQAAAAEQANAQAREFARRQLRPEILVASIERPSEANERMTHIVHLKNVGLTAAYEAQMQRNEAFVPAPKNSIFVPPTAFDSGARPSDAAAETEGASLEFGITHSHGPYSKNDIQEFKKGNTVYMVWGIVQYKDCERFEHFTRYCYYFINGDLGSMVTCNQHNETN